MTTPVAPPATGADRRRGGGIVGAFAFLTWHTARNRVRQQARRLRNPRYIAALVFGAVYFYFALFRQSRPGGPTPSVLFGTGADVILALGLVLLATRWWLFGGDQTALAFSPAEVHFLFPAPVSRRSLVHFKLLRSQVVILLNTLLWVALLRKGSASLSLWLRALAFWVLFSTLTLHRLGASLVRTSASEHGAAGARRGVVPMVVFGAIVTTLAVALVGALPALRTATGPLDFFAKVKHALQAPLPAAVLLPFRAVLRPSLAGGVAEWARAFWPAALIMALHYLWVVRSNAAFEEAAVEASERRAARIAAIREGRARPPFARAGGRGRRLSRPWFPLAPTGSPAVAILWKNLIAVSRAFRWTSVLVLVAGIGAVLAVVSWQSSPPDAGALLATIAGVWAGLTVVTGPLWVRNDLRQDLTKLALLRAYPLRGSQVVAAQIASSALVLTALQYVLLGVCYLALLGNHDVSLGVKGRALLLAGACVALPAVNAASLAIQNAVALLFPSWVRLGAGSRPGGVEAMGQNVLSTALAMIVLTLLLLVPVALGGAAVYALRDALGRPAWAVGLAGAIAVLAGELAMVVRWMGEVFERTEPVEG